MIMRLMWAVVLSCLALIGEPRLWAQTLEAATALTVTPTPWPTVTLTPTLVEPTATDTPTASPTSTDSPNPSWTHTDTVVYTPTVTATDTPSPTRTVTDTATTTATPTLTSTPGIAGFKVVPDRLPGPVTLTWEYSMAVHHPSLKVFTSSFRLYKSFGINGSDHPDWLKPGPKQLVWNGLDDRGMKLPPGTYFIFLTARNGKNTYTTKAQIVSP